MQVAPPFPPGPLLIDEVGVYRVIQEIQGRQAVNSFVANFFMPEESELSPSELPLLKTELVQERESRKVPWEMTTWLALAALAILGLEWWVYKRGY